MSSITSDQQFLNAKGALSEPHFDQEATVLSARPVVPLEEVTSLTARNFWKRPWVLGLGLAGALLVGVFATAIYYSQSNGDDSSLIEGSEVAAGAEGFSEESVNSFSGPASSQPMVENVKPAAITQPSPVNSRPGKASETEKKPRLVAVIRERQSDNDIEDDQENDRRADRREARRERRRAERRGRDRKSSDELLRIRDIFEGSPRP